MAIEDDIAAMLATRTENNFALLAERKSDGAQVYVVKGAINERWISSSIGKPISNAVILDLIARSIGGLMLTTKIADVCPAVAANMTATQARTELRHLLSFTSGMSKYVPATTYCWQKATWAEHLACVEQLPLASPSIEPGSVWAYSTSHLDLAGVMAVAVSAMPDWSALCADWRSRTGLFPGLTWDTGKVFSASSHYNVTAQEYLAFLRALDEQTIASPRLCAQMATDQMPHMAVRNPTTWQAPPRGLREDHRFGLGVWLEQAEYLTDWHTSRPRRIYTVGTASQYGAIDREAGYRIVVTPSFAGTWAGLEIARACSALLDAWAGA